jgi:hypothetical protein
MARTTKNPGVFASDAETTIPTTPIVGESYRDTTLASISDGWPFKAIVDSAEFNQFMHQLTSFTQLIDKTGVLKYHPDIDYDDVPAYAVGSDGELYKSTAVNGPATTVRNPVGDSSGTWVPGPGHVGITYIDATTTYSPPVGVRVLEFLVIGGGGGGGGVDGGGTGQTAASTGGGSAGASKKLITNIESSYSINIGAGGLGGAAGSNNGSSGGASSVTSPLVNILANGGGGGTGQAASSSSYVRGGGTGGTASGGDLNLTGNYAANSTVVLGDTGCTSGGAPSILGGGTYVVNGGNGLDGRAPGAGGAGSLRVDSGANQSGGDGANGIVIIKEYF